MCMSSEPSYRCSKKALPYRSHVSMTKWRCGDVVSRTRLTLYHSATNLDLPTAAPTVRKRLLRSGVKMQKNFLGTERAAGSQTGLAYVPNGLRCCMNGSKSELLGSFTFGTITPGAVSGSCDSMAASISRR